MSENAQRYKITGYKLFATDGEVISLIDRIVSGFLRGRSISGSIFFLNEVIANFQRKRDDLVRMSNAIQSSASERDRSCTGQ